MFNLNIVAEFSGDNLKLFKVGTGIILNAEVSSNLKKDVRKAVPEQQTKIAVVASAGATEERIATEKAILYSVGFSELVYLQPTVALGAYLGYRFVETNPIMSVVIGEEGTDVAIILGAKVLYSGILDIGVNTCLTAITDFVAEKFHVEIGYETALEIYREIASLLPNDNRFAKFSEFIIKAEQVREVIYPLYAQIIGAINHLLSEASVEIIRQINNSGVLFGGIGAGIRGLPQAVYSVIGLQSLIADDENNANLIGTGMLLATPKTFLNLAEHT